MTYHNLKISCNPVDSKIQSHRKQSNSDPPDPRGYTQTHKTSFFPRRLAGLFLNMFLASPSYHTYIVAHHNLKISLQCIRTLKHFACCLTMEACAHRFFIFSPTTCWFILDSGCHNLIGPFCITYIYWRITLLPKPFQVPLQKSIQCNPAMLSTLSLLKYSGVILTSDFFIVILIQVLRLLETHPTAKTVA